MNDLRNFYKGKKVLITGNSGFKGSWLTQILLLYGAKVSGISLKPHTRPSLFSLLKLEKNIKNHFVDIRDYEKVKKVIEIEKPEIVFHLAAQPIVRESYEKPLYTFETNTIGTANILEAIRSQKSVRSVLMVTTDKVYEDQRRPILYKEGDRLGGFDPYSSSKASAEMVINAYTRSFFNPENYKTQHRTLVASARAGNVIGGGDWSKDRIIPDIVRSVFELNKEIIIRNPNAIRPWQYVLEPLWGYLLIAKELYEGRAEFSGSWNLGPNKNNFLKVEGLLATALDGIGRGSYRVVPDKKLYETHLLMLDSGKAKKFLGWHPVLSAPETIKMTVDWYRSFYAKENMIDFTKKQIEYYFKKMNTPPR